MGAGGESGLWAAAAMDSAGWAAAARVSAGWDPTGRGWEGKRAKNGASGWEGRGVGKAEVWSWAGGLLEAMGGG